MSRTSETANISYELHRLFLCSVIDLETRLGIVYREARHLQMNIGSLSGNKKLVASLIEEYENSPNNPIETSKIWEAFSIYDPNDAMFELSRNLATTMQSLKESIWRDVGFLTEAKKVLEEWDPGKPVKLSNISWFLYRQTVLRGRAGEYVRHLGRCQDRLSQTLDSRPPHQIPLIVRRRKENVTSDKYLTLLSNWVHRDLILMATRCFGHNKCFYPYNEVPLTTQHLGHHYTSNQYYVINRDIYPKWQHSVYSPPPPLKSKHQASPNNQDDFLPPYGETVMMVAGYWMLEREVLHPIMGHILSLPVIRASLGKLDTHILAIEDKNGDFGVLARGIITIMDNWLTDTPDHSAFCQRILADLMAASRFGYAYLYPWFLEMLDVTKTWATYPVTDEFDNMDDDSTFLIEPDDFPVRDSFESPSFSEDYLRGQALLTWLARMGIGNDDLFAQSLHKAVHDYFKLIMRTRFIDNPVAVHVTEGAGLDLANFIGEIHHPINVVKFINAMFSKTPPENESWSAWRQQLPENVRKEIINHLKNCMINFVATSSSLGTNSTTHKAPQTLPDITHLKIYGSTDIAWRMEWLLADSSFLSTYAMDVYFAQVTAPIHFQKALSKPTHKTEDDNYTKLLIDINICINLWKKSYSKILKGDYYDVAATFICEQYAGINFYPNLDTNNNPIQVVTGSDNNYYNYFMDLITMPDYRVGRKGDKLTWLNNLGLNTHAKYSIILGEFDVIAICGYKGLYQPEAGFSLKDPTLMIHKPESNQEQNFNEPTTKPVDPPGDETESPSISNSSFPDRRTGKTNPPQSLPYYDRRRLVRIVLDNSDPDEPELPKMFVFVELKHPGFRIAFTNWVLQNFPKNKIPSGVPKKTGLVYFYRSSGWEDFILIFKIDDIKDAYNILDKLNENALVRNIVHIFDEYMLSFFPEEGFCIDIYCKSRCKIKDMKILFKNIYDSIKSIDIINFEIKRVYGEYDLIISLPKDLEYAKIIAVRDKLMSLQDMIGLETSVQYIKDITNI